MDIIIGFLLLAIIGTIFALFKVSSSTNENTKTQSLEQLTQKYEQELRDILDQYSHDPQEQKKQKKLYLQQLNATLSRNIYFSEEEAKKFIQKLAGL